MNFSNLSLVSIANDHDGQRSFCEQNVGETAKLWVGVVLRGNYFFFFKICAKFFKKPLIGANALY